MSSWIFRSLQHLLLKIWIFKRFYVWNSISLILHLHSHSQSWIRGNTPWDISHRGCFIDWMRFTFLFIFGFRRQALSGTVSLERSLIPGFPWLDRCLFWFAIKFMLMMALTICDLLLTQIVLNIRYRLLFLFLFFLLRMRFYLP